jgi:hypothetical protein
MSQAAFQTSARDSDDSRPAMWLTTVAIERSSSRSLV